MCTHVQKTTNFICNFLKNAFLSPPLTFWAKDVWLNQFKQQHKVWHQSIPAEIKAASTESIDSF